MSAFSLGRAGQSPAWRAFEASRAIAARREAREVAAAEAERRGADRQSEIVDAVQAVLSAPAPDPIPYVPRCEAIIREVAAEHRIRVWDLLGQSRTVPLVLARHEAMYRCVVETAQSYPQIGRWFGGRDHTTVMHGVRRHCERNGLALPRGMPERAK